MSDVEFDGGTIVMPVRDILNTTEILENIAAYHPGVFPVELPLESVEFSAFFQPAPPTPLKVIFNPPATIVFWNDGEKTVVKCMEGEEYSKDVGLAMCFCKKMLGSGYKRMFKKWCREEK